MEKDYDEEAFQISSPGITETTEFAPFSQNRREIGRLLKDVIGVADGGILFCANFTDVNLQKAYFEGFTQAVEVTNLFVFNFFGELIQAAVNFRKVGMTRNLHQCLFCIIQSWTMHILLVDMQF